MKCYFTPERVQELLAQCEAAGINTWQSGPVNLEAYTFYVQQGGHMQYIALAHDSPDDPQMLQRPAAPGSIGIAHHGEVTKYFGPEAPAFRRGEEGPPARFIRLPIWNICAIIFLAR